MDCEDQYQRRVLSIAATAKAIEEKWVKENPDNQQLVDQKPSFNIHGGGYRSMGWLPSHPDFSWSTCARCNGSPLVTESIVAGCRHNGDGYGSEVYYCSTCGFLCWCSYDEA